SCPREDDPIEFLTLLIDEAERHGGAPAGRCWNQIESDEAVVAVSDLGPVDRLEGLAEVELADVGTFARLLVSDHRRPAAGSDQEVPFRLALPRPSVARCPRGAYHHVCRSIGRRLDLGGLTGRRRH